MTGPHLAGIHSSVAGKALRRAVVPFLLAPFLRRPNPRSAAARSPARGSGEASGMALPEDLVEEFLLRLPPSEPASLVRAALVCKPWFRLISSRRFRRRFRAFHRTPPMLGFIRNTGEGFGPYVARFVPTSSFRASLAADDRDWVALDARHGYVLLSSVDSRRPHLLVVWNPVTDERWQVPLLVQPLFGFAATVLCAASGASDHLDCLHGTFLVAVICVDILEPILSVYSSESGSWSQLILLPQCDVDSVPTALVGNTIYFRIQSSSGSILSYDLATRETRVIELPESIRRDTNIMMIEDGGLGVAIAQRGEEHPLALWSLETSLSGDIGWAQIRVIELQKLLHGKALSKYYTPVVGSAPGILFITTDDGLFSFNLKSDQVKKELDNDENEVLRVVPYMSFYTPEFRVSNR